MEKKEESAECQESEVSEISPMKNKDTLNTTKENDNNVPIQTSEFTLTDEHSYANVDSEIPSKHHNSTDIENNDLDDSMLTESVSTLDTINNVMDGLSEQIDINGYNAIHTVISEVVITEEVITIDNNDIHKHSENIKDLKSKNSNNRNDNKKTTDLFYIDNQTSLAAIAAQYDSSDSEDENSETAVKVSNVKNYRNKDEVELSSDETSDSESDSSSSDSESSSDLSDSDSSKSDNSSEKSKIKKKGNNSKKVFKPKTEYDDLPPIEDLKISVPEVLCDPLGEVAWTVEQMVVVRPKPGKPTLNLDTILFINKGQRALGHIFDVFGQVAEPHYCVRFNSSDHIKEYDIKVGMTVYYCPNTEYTSLVFLSELTKMKAIDEIGDDEPPQFSDDEEEQAYLATLRNKASNNKQKDAANERPNKRKRGNKTVWQSSHPWSSNREYQQMQPNAHPPNSRPFYRTQHPWSRPRYPQPNSWHQYNSYPHNQWMGQYTQYNDYLGTAQAPPIEMQNVRFPQMQWNPHYPLPQINAVPVPRLPQTLVPSFTIPPPPPPPPPNADA